MYKRQVPALRTHRKDWCPDFKFYWEHLRIALPMGFQSSIIAIGAVILQVALNDLGPTAVAAYAAAQKIESIAMMPMMSFGIAMSAYTAQNYGARKFERIGEGVRKCCYMSVTLSLIHISTAWSAASISSSASSRMPRMSSGHR